MVGSSGLAQRLARKEARLLKEERRGAGKCAGIPAQDLRRGREISAALVVALLLLAEAAADGRSFRRCRRVQPLSRRGLADQRGRVNLAHARRAVGLADRLEARAAWALRTEATVVRVRQ